MQYVVNLLPLDHIDPAFGLPFAVILWAILVIVVLVQHRRSKVKRQKAARLIQEAARRETFIFMKNQADEKYLESLPKKIKRY